MTFSVSAFAACAIDSLKQLVMVDFQEQGSNAREIEMQAWVHFGDFLDECEGVHMHSSPHTPHPSPLPHIIDTYLFVITF